MKESSNNEIDFFEFLRLAPEQLSSNLQLNLQMRMKFPTETTKFYSSEQQINEILTTFQSKLQQTEQSSLDIINEIINSKILISLLKTLQHPNLDINISAINCFYSLIIEMSEQIEQGEKNENQNQKEQNKITQSYASFFRMNIWFIENGFIQSLFKILNRADEQKLEQYQACRKILKIIQYLLQLSQTVYPILVRQTGIVAFLTNRIMPNFTVSHRVIDDNKFIVSDILLALLQTPQVQQGLSAVRQFYKSFAIQVIIQTVSSYENKLPTAIDQRQYLMNLFDCLNVMLISVKQCRKQFHGMKGCYLMVSYICNKSQYAVPALKAFSNSLDNQADSQFNKALCDQIVNDGSLKYIFPILNMQGLKGKDDQQQGQINQHILTIIYYLIRNSAGVSRDRILYKFTEKRFEKLQRIFEILVENKGNNLKSQQIQITAEDYIMLMKDQGLALVQICFKIIVTLWKLLPKAQQKIKALLPLYSLKYQDMKVTIQRHYKFIDEGPQKQYIAKLIATNLREIQQQVSL